MGKSLSADRKGGEIKRLRSTIFEGILRQKKSFRIHLSIILQTVSEREFGFNIVCQTVRELSQMIWDI